MPCVHHWHGTSCQKWSGIFSRCNCLSLVSRLTCSAAPPDTGKQDTDTDIVTADISRPCNGVAMLRHVINWRIYWRPIVNAWPFSVSTVCVCVCERVYISITMKQKPLIAMTWNLAVGTMVVCVTVSKPVDLRFRRTGSSFYYGDFATPSITFERMKLRAPNFVY